jgi:2-hydroxy-6-oxonona-2,4-dienedioate hydrolase
MPTSLDEARYREAEGRLWASLGARPTEQRLELARTGSTVRVQEIGAGPAVVFVHGANTSGASWAALAAGLTGFRCILLDRPGTGLSEPPSRPVDADSLPAFADALVVDVLDALKLPSAHLVATSFGGYIALRTAATSPDRIERMVLFSWSAGLPVERLPGFMRLMAAPILGRLAAVMPANDRSVGVIFRGLGHGPSLADGRITAEDVDAYLGLLRHTDTMRNELAMGRALISPRGRLRVPLPDALLARIRSPTLLLWGEDDPFGGAETAQALAARLPDATLELLIAAGHAPWLDARQRCVDATGQFLAG